METPSLKFRNLLRELFQFDCADLDFGIYRIMNQKRALIEDFIEKDLVGAVAKELKKGALKEQGGLAEQLAALAAKIREDIGDDAIDPDGKLDPRHAGIKLGRQYLELQERAAGSATTSELEAQVFNHLWNFFSRYYDNGDFLSTRRYSRREKYAIPYNGEEVYLHWANRDQYYIKTGEHFTDYQWKAGDVSVLFKLVQADTEKDNVKADKKRVFVPRLDEVSVDKKAVTIPFEYRALTEQENITYGKKNQQDAIVAQLLESLPKRKALKESPATLGALLAEYRKTNDGESVSRLDHHLRRYTARSTRDYFIHKDLAGFLTRELDFYLKNEVLALDDLALGDADRAEGWFQLLQAIRAVGGKIIAFMAQIEDFQKRVFEKRKFVTETNYCFTLDRVPKALWPVILKNKAQIAEWRKLYSIEDLKGYADPLKPAFLETWSSMMIDTAFFADNPEFVDTLLAAQEDLEESLGGLLIHSENFQALNLLLPRFKERVKCIYIDPPYNRGGNDFLYKDNFRHSSWMSMATDRIALGRAFLEGLGVLCSSIDENERAQLDAALANIFGPENKVEELIWVQNTTHSQSPAYSTNHEYIEVFARDKARAENDPAMFREPKPGARELRELIEKLNPAYPPIEEVEKNISKAMEVHVEVFTAELQALGLEYNEDTKKIDPWRGIYPYSHAEYRTADGRLISERNAKREKAVIWIWRESDPSAPAGKQSETTKNQADANYRLYRPKHPKTGKPCACPKRGWGFPYDWPDDERDSFVSYERNNRIVWGIDETRIPQFKRFLHEVETNVSKSVFHDYTDGEKEVTQLFGATDVFSNPKPTTLVSRFVLQTCRAGDLVLDFFAGSGTTAHAVLNASDEAACIFRWLLCEQGQHAEAIISPRIMKRVFSRVWKDGKPTLSKHETSSGISHAFKSIKLESYEDALGNISFDESQGSLKFDDYVLRYMLKFETGASVTLLNIGKLAAPFSYRLEIMEGGERKTKPVDLPETFNYLLGLTISCRKVRIRDGKHRYLVIRGMTNPHGAGGEREVVVIWRDVTGWKSADFKADAEFVEKEKLTDGADDVFANADLVIPGARVLDPVFKERMFAPVMV